MGSLAQLSRLVLIGGCVWSAAVAAFLAWKMAPIFRPLLIAIAVWSLIFADGMARLAGRAPTGDWLGRFTIPALNFSATLSLAGWSVLALWVWVSTRHGRQRIVEVVDRIETR